MHVEGNVVNMEHSFAGTKYKFSQYGQISTEVVQKVHSDYKISTT